MPFCLSHCIIFAEDDDGDDDLYIKPNVWQSLFFSADLVHSLFQTKEGLISLVFLIFSESLGVTVLKIN